nr:MAG TPA: hypothetical protein [Siphoviridae sp. ctEfY6]
MLIIEIVGVWESNPANREMLKTPSCYLTPLPECREFHPANLV